MFYGTKDAGLIIKAIKDGKIVAVPTDTLFGLCCDVNNITSVRRIYEIKNRPFTLPLSIAVKNKDYIYKITKNVSKKAEEIIDTYFPGQVTIVLEKNNLIPDIVTANSKYVGIRIPNDGKLLYILNELDSPIVLTSANLHGYENCQNLDDVKKQIGDEIDYVYNVSTKVNNKCSTIVRVINNNAEILRNGVINIII